MTTNDGGPAFPVTMPTPEGGITALGMSLRDSFALSIAVGMAAHSGTSGASYGPGEIASRSYEVADAMLAARAKGGDA